MIDGIYNVTVKTPIGVNRGSLKLETTADGEAVKASLSLIGMGNLYSNGKLNGNEFTMQGNMRMFTFGHFAYNIKGAVEGRKLHAIAETSRGTFSIQGTRI
ncbi:MAG: hypothetical protein Q4C36_02930 [Coriobacteriia bacterium]|jgi:hypothetical protein|nr:hypothetical protein [Coriobacteriia bacterium]